MPLRMHVRGEENSTLLHPLSPHAKPFGVEASNVALNAGGPVRTVSFRPVSDANLPIILVVGTSQIGYYESSVDENSDVTTATACRWGVGSELRRLRLQEQKFGATPPALLQLWEISLGIDGAQPLQATLKYMVGLEGKGGAWQLEWSAWHKGDGTMLGVAALVTNNGGCSILHFPDKVLTNHDLSAEAFVLSDSSVTVFNIPASRKITCCAWSCEPGKELVLATGTDKGEVLLWDFTAAFTTEGATPTVSEAFKEDLHLEVNVMTG